MAESHSATPDHSSPESFEVEDDSSHQIPSSQWNSNNITSPGGTKSSPSQQQTRVVPPMQKRRRVTRACDECRRKKIKCDGKQPCTHCTVYSYDCTYDQPSNRRRNPAPQYIEHLENRLQRAEALLRTFIPNLDIKDPNFDSLLHQRQAKVDLGPVKSESVVSVDSEQENPSQDAQIRSMISATGQLDLDERGDWDFHGGSSGAVFLRRMREQFGGLLGGGDPRAPFLPRPPRLLTMPSALESPRSSESPYESGLPNVLDLPSKEIAFKLSYYALNRACSLLRFVHGPSFYEMFDRIYDTPVEDYGDAENRFLPLLYVVLALGGMFSEDPIDCPESEQAIYKIQIEQGLKYFRAGRAMMDITDCRDTVSLQAILFMILFLQSSSNLSTCYSYIGIALRSACRLGMHRNVSDRFNPIERETRRRVFWVIRKMDTYVAALLGFPRMLSEDDIDQDLPLEVDDECLTKDGILPMPEGKISVYAASNAHTRLMGILSKVIKYIYPIKGVEQAVHPTSSQTYVISHARIKEVEGDLKDWLDKLPMALRPGGDAPEDVVRVQQLLRMAYAHVQMMVYRPFLHYVSQKYSTGKTLDDRSYACAAACVSVSRNIVHITTEMKRRGLLIGAYWFTVYTTFFAILSLAFFVLENPDKPGSQDILADAISGKEALNDLAKRSQAADRCNTALNSLFEKLPEKLRRSQTEPIMSKKKRSASSLNNIGVHKAKSSPDATINRPSIPNTQRATTFPYPINIPSANRQSASFDSPRYPSSATEPKFRRSFHELMSPADMSSSATPDSTGPTNSSLHTPFGLQQAFNTNNGIPDLGAMMFPSADPFAYPNQPMIDFDARQPKHEYIGNMLDASPMPMYLPNTSSGSGPYDSIEGQLFGPLPPYLMQNQGNMDMSQLNMNGMAAAGPGNPQDVRAHSGLTPGVGMNFDEIFAEGGEEWSNMFAESGYLQ